MALSKEEASSQLTGKQLELVRRCEHEIDAELGKRWSSQRTEPNMDNHP